MLAKSINTDILGTWVLIRAVIMTDALNALKGTGIAYAKGAVIVPGTLDADKSLRMAGSCRT